jgi:hypothetical protein
MGTPSMDDLLRGAVDCHVHACPHINARSLDVFEAAREAAAAGMRGLGLMDNFSNSSGYAALAQHALGQGSIDIWGGLIMEPPAGGVSAEAVAIALAYGYGPGTGARFVSLPTHHTRHVARAEGRSPLYVEACFEVPRIGAMPDPLPEILDLIARVDVVFNTGHVAPEEAIRLVEFARSRGVQRILVPASSYDDASIAAVLAAGAYGELSYFFASPAAGVPLTHVDAEAHPIAGVAIGRMAEVIRRHGAEKLILSSDCGVSILPKPVEGLRLFLNLLHGQGIDKADLATMVRDNPARLFQVGA